MSVRLQDMRRARFARRAQRLFNLLYWSIHGFYRCIEIDSVCRAPSAEGVKARGVR